MARAWRRMALLASLTLGAAAQAAGDCSVTLDGKSLTAAQVLAVARQDCAVAIAPAAARRAAPTTCCWPMRAWTSRSTA
ncbi:hypothetical protein WJ972_21180 [Achromobacter insuavis]